MTQPECCRPGELFGLLSIQWQVVDIRRQCVAETQGQPDMQELSAGRQQAMSDKERSRQERKAKARHLSLQSLPALHTHALSLLLTVQPCVYLALTLTLFGNMTPACFLYRPGIVLSSAKLCILRALFLDYSIMQPCILG